ncbi:glycosyltransferase family 1 protein [Streptomyces sp. R302]|uniref:glycosyltransferase n=1 Tax=unclassified Streptomyces TaxID=2593676 RepID=UPI00145EEEA5|nr:MULTISPECIES: glycosyltransferase [unclassified Streptomyces]NML52654.1 glycosyltransferase family 1 protein [Streptomyces sp. R301]NML80417.1 glycosyltransferase family 1 protein [Streptomyces sp. R302]
MRVVVSAYGARGSVEPMAGLAEALRERGAEVRVCAPPDGEFTELLDGSGVAAIPVGAPVRPLVTTVKPGSAVGLAQRAADLMAAQFGPVAEAAEGCDVVVATGPLPVTAGARSVAERLGVPYVYATHTPVVLPSPHQPPPGRRGRPLPPDVEDNRELWDLDARLANDMFGAMLGAFRDAAGLPPVDDVRGYAFTDRPWLAADPVLSPWPTAGIGIGGGGGGAVDVVRTGAWFRPVARPLPPEVTAFLKAGPPPVYVGFGSTPLGTAGSALARAAIEAARERSRRVILARGWAGLTPTDDGDDCLAVDEADHQALFARVAAVIHHGGAGTTTTAARAGTPQVIVPRAGDQPYWADRIATLGLGATLPAPPPEPPSPTVLSAALATALSPETRARAEAVRGRIRDDGATVAAGLLFETAGR